MIQPFQSDTIFSSFYRTILHIQTDKAYPIDPFGLKRVWLVTADVFTATSLFEILRWSTKELIQGNVSWAHTLLRQGYCDIRNANGTPMGIIALSIFSDYASFQL